ncbi:MAG: RpoL/Rpb11 RNA polymerase subunit family protein [Candidatus Micrarchaeaceae archaeon]
MKLNLIEDKKDSLIIEFEGVDRAIPELVKGKLLDNKDVNFVSVIKEHFEVSKPRLVVKSEKNAKSLVLKAVEELEEELEDLQSQIPKK